MKPKAVVRELDGITWMTWQFSAPVEKASLQLKGSAEIYGVATDGKAGVTVDNIPLRGSTGTILTRIPQDLMKASYELDDTRLIILQFGGNFVPSARSAKSISYYMDKVRDQIAYFQEVAPEARILFIGPSDMGSFSGGERGGTFYRLPEVVDSLKATTLRCGAAYWDLYRMMGGHNSMVQWVRHQPPYAGPDYIHFTTTGARLVGETLSRSLLTYYDFYDLRKTLPAAAVEQHMAR
jgi:lysophospholipase L1-like esterase